MDERTGASGAADLAAPKVEAGAATAGEGDVAALRRLRRANRALRQMAVIHEAQRGAPDVDAYFGAVCRDLVEGGPVAAAWVGLAERAPARRVISVARHGAGSDALAESSLAHDARSEGLDPARRALRSGAPLSVPRVDAEPPSAWRELALREGLASAAALPLSLGDELAGVLVLYAREPDVLDGEELEAWAEVARAIAAVARDVTARKRAEEDLQRLNAELEGRVARRTQELAQSRDELSAANAALERGAIAKDEFLASMSHELRTPLNAILGLSEAFQEEIYGPVAEPQRRALARIEESGRHLLSLINDILDLSKVEAGQVTLDPQPTSLDEVCRASLRMVQEAAHKKGIAVSYAVDDGLAILLADERSLKQVLVNLLSNAVKFTREGGSMGLEVTTSAEEETCTFSVWDTGIGIAAVDQARLFRPFVQLDSSLARRHAGTGLGLALVRRLVELHGGGIRVESAPDAGSRFTVVVPWRRATRGDDPPSTLDARPTHPRPTTPRARVLLAEDDATNVALVSDFFRAHGFELTVARNGYEAISLAHELVPDLVLMDIQMPLLDGIAALRAIRQSATPEVRRIPVIAVTALAMPGDLERCRDAGADDYITKPLRLRRLLEAIEARIPALGAGREPG